MKKKTNKKIGGCSPAVWCDGVLGKRWLLTDIVLELAVGWAHLYCPALLPQTA